MHLGVGVQHTAYRAHTVSLPDHLAPITAISLFRATVPNRSYGGCTGGATSSGIPAYYQCHAPSRARFGLVVAGEGDISVWRFYWCPPPSVGRALRASTPTDTVRKPHSDTMGNVMVDTLELHSMYLYG